MTTEPFASGKTAKEQRPCPECFGNGWVSGSEAGHGCDGTEEDCQRTCPVQIQIQVVCDFCGGTGYVTPPEDVAPVSEPETMEGLRKKRDGRTWKNLRNIMRTFFSLLKNELF